MLSFKDFLIFYLACGASFSASYFFQNRKKLAPYVLRLKTFLTFFVWIPYALEVLHEFVTRKFPNVFSFDAFSHDVARARHLERIEKNLSSLLAGSKAKISVFEFRDAFARYAGLSAACLSISEDDNPGKAGQQLFRLTAHKNPALGARCRFRQNAFKLRRHRKLARRDLLSLFENLYFSGGQAKQLRHLTFELFELLGDAEALKAMDEVFSSDSQTDSAAPVLEMEKDLWNPIRQLPLLKTSAKPQPASTARLRRD